MYPEIHSADEDIEQRARGLSQLALHGGPLRPAFMALCILIGFTVAAVADNLEDLEARFEFCLSTEFYEIDSCYDTIKNEAEAEMVNAYLAAKGALQAFDETERQVPPLVDLLQNAQVAFEEYRAIHCEFPDRYVNGLGNLYSWREESVCHTELTLARIAQLRKQSTLDYSGRTSP